jgi:hypothetical protein
MNVGLPGTGIGGLFYFFSMLILLGIELARLLGGKKVDAHTYLALRLLPMMGGAIAAMFFLDWVLDKVLSSVHQQLTGTTQTQSIDVLAFTPIIVSTGVLCMVVLSVYIMRLFIKPRQNAY